MDGSVLIALLIILSIVLIIALVVYAAGRQAQATQKKMKDELQRITSMHGLQIETKELFRNRLIGLDSTNSKLVYIKYSEGNVITSIIDLSLLQNCEVFKVGSTTTETNASGVKHKEEHVIELQLLVNLRDKTQINLVFYNAMEDGVLELQKARKTVQHWRDKLSAL